MIFKRINLYTKHFEEEKDFYSNLLGFELIQENSSFFTVKIGWTELSFSKSDRSHLYHYCFLIPSNQLEEGLDWLEKRTPVIEIEKGRKTQYFESWNADSFYFSDASGNLAEFIVRHDLKNSTNDNFQAKSVLGLNEIGLPTRDIVKTNGELERLLGTKFWKGDPNRFGTNGNQEGLFLLPDYKIKNKWFPTNQLVKPEPFEAVVENMGRDFGIRFHDEKIEKIQLSDYQL